jgi:hypothetical protein
MSDIPKPIDDLHVYLKWPEELIKKALWDFKHGPEGMYNGAGIEELLAGLHCLDFMTRASDVSEDTAMFIDAAVSEAEMRIELMAQQEQKSADPDALKKAIVIVTSLEQQVKRLLSGIMMFREMDADELHEYVQKRIAYYRS